MKHICVTAFLIFVWSTAFNQHITFNDSISSSRNSLTQTSMLVLGSWAVANIGSGFIMANQTNGEAKYAWRMNSYWNMFNLGLAGLGYLSAKKAMRNKESFSSNFKKQQTVEKLYLFNAGLDVAYIAGGFYLRERGKNQADFTKRDRLKGYGTSIAIQGGFLLLLDAVMYKLHRGNTKKMNKKLESIDIGISGNGVGLSYNF